MDRRSSMLGRRLSPARWGGCLSLGASVSARLIVLVALFALLAACGGSATTGATAAPSTGTTTGATTTRPTTTGGTTSGATTTSATATASTTSGSGTTTSSPSLEGRISVATVASGLRVPWEMRFLPDGSLLVTERGGRIVQVDVTTGAVAEVGTIEVLARGESGLMGMALDPGYPAQPYIYVSYTHSGGVGAAVRVSRFELTGAGGDKPALGNEKVLVDGIGAANIHDGSRVAFGPDGYLYVTTGDSGTGGLAQDLRSLNGKVLRMTRDGAAAPGNPFDGSLIYTYGHRNPQGLTFHPITGRPYVTEHGPDANDEINRLEAGKNYGWPLVGGSPGDSRFVDAIFSWTPTIAPAGAVFYDSDAIPGLRGDFLFVTLKERDLRRLTPTSPDDFTAVAREEVLLDGQLGRLRAIAVSSDGTIYLSTSNRDGRGNPSQDDDRIVRLEIR